MDLSTLNGLIGVFLVALILYLFLYGILDRICKCIENCKTAKAYGSFAETLAKANKQSELIPLKEYLDKHPELKEDE